MPIITNHISFSTLGNADIIDITPQVSESIASARFSDGIVCIFAPGATGAITTIEYEPGAVSDLKRTLEHIAPSDIEYEHNRRWGDGNGHSHIRAALLGPSLSVPVTDGHLMLGTWQQIIFIDLDNRARSRELIVQMVGE